MELPQFAQFGLVCGIVKRKKREGFSFNTEKSRGCQRKAEVYLNHRGHRYMGNEVMK